MNFSTSMTSKCKKFYNQICKKVKNNGKTEKENLK